MQKLNFFLSVHSQEEFYPSTMRTMRLVETHFVFPHSSVKIFESDKNGRNYRLNILQWTPEMFKIYMLSWGYPSAVFVGKNHDHWIMDQKAKFFYLTKLLHFSDFFFFQIVMFFIYFFLIFNSKQDFKVFSRKTL